MNRKITNNNQICFLQEIIPLIGKEGDSHELSRSGCRGFVHRNQREKKTMKGKKKMKIRKCIRVFGIVAAIFSIGVISASAFDLNMPSTGTPVTLTYSQTSALSAEVNGRYKYFKASNSSSSKHAVYATAMYKSGGSWHDDKQVLMPIGGNTGSQELETYHFVTSVTWVLELNPQGYGYTKCTASGYIRNT